MHGILNIKCVNNYLCLQLIVDQNCEKKNYRRCVAIELCHVRHLRTGHQMVQELKGETFRVFEGISFESLDKESKRKQITWFPFYDAA
jgi:hypothetical protein